MPLDSLISEASPLLFFVWSTRLRLFLFFCLFFWAFRCASCTRTNYWCLANFGPTRSTLILTFCPTFAPWTKITKPWTFAIPSPRLESSVISTSYSFPLPQACYLEEGPIFFLLPWTRSSFSTNDVSFAIGQLCAIINCAFRAKVGVVWEGICRIFAIIFCVM